MVYVFMLVGMVFLNLFVVLVYGMLRFIGVLFYVLYGIFNVMFLFVVLDYIKEVLIDCLGEIG